MKKLLLPLLILSLSLSLFACGEKESKIPIDSGNNTATTMEGGPIGPSSTTEVTGDADKTLGDFVAYAEDDNFTYTLYKSGAAVTGFKGSGEVTVPASVNGTAVKVIARDAFRDVSTLTKITLPDGLSAISINAFYNCSALTEITVPSGCAVGDKAFAFATALTTASIPNSTLGKGIFYGCTALVSCTLPETMTEIPDQTFYGCTSLVYSIPSNITIIGSEAFFSCTALTEIVLPDTLHSVGASAFYNCTGVTSLTLPATPAAPAPAALAAPAEEGEGEDDTDSPAPGEGEGEGEEGEGEGDGSDETTGTGSGESNPPVTPADPTVDPVGFVYIGDYAFCNLSGVTQVTIPDSVVYIGSFSFAGTGLTSVEIPANMTSGTTVNYTGIGKVTSGIGSGAFANCLGLTEFTLPKEITAVPELLLYGCSNVTEVNYVSDKVTRINKGAFAKTGVSVTNIPDTVTSLGASAYQGCVNLTEINLGEKVTIISASAFQGCTALETLNIPVTVSAISGSAFQGCTSLSALNFESEASDILFDTRCFLDCPNLKSVTFPAGCSKNFSGQCFGYLTDPDDSTAYIPLEGFHMSGYIGGTFENYAKTYAKDIAAQNGTETLTEDFLTIIGLLGYTPYDQFEWKMAAPAASTEGEDAAAQPVGLILTKYTGSDADVKIPATFRLNEKEEISLFGVDRRVVSIADSAFAGNTAIESVTFPATVEAIGANAFNGCSKLAAADLLALESLTSVGENAFLNTAAFKVYLPAGLKADGIGAHAFCFVQTGTGEPTVPEVGFYQYKATEYVLDKDGNIEEDKDGNPKTTTKTYDNRADVPEDAVSVENIPNPPTIYCSGAGGKAYAEANGIATATPPAAPAA